MDIFPTVHQFKMAQLVTLLLLASSISALDLQFRPILIGRPASAFTRLARQFNPTNGIPALVATDAFIPLGMEIPLVNPPVSSTTPAGGIVEHREIDTEDTISVIQTTQTPLAVVTEQIRSPDVGDTFLPSFGPSTPSSTAGTFDDMPRSTEPNVMDNEKINDKAKDISSNVIEPPFPPRYAYGALPPFAPVAHRSREPSYPSLNNYYSSPFSGPYYPKEYSDYSPGYAAREVGYPPSLAELGFPGAPRSAYASTRELAYDAQPSTFSRRTFDEPPSPYELGFPGISNTEDNWKYDFDWGRIGRKKRSTSRSHVTRSRHNDNIAVESSTGPSEVRVLPGAGDRKIRGSSDTKQEYEGPYIYTQLFGPPYEVGYIRSPIPSKHVYEDYLQFVRSWSAASRDAVDSHLKTKPEDASYYKSPSYSATASKEPGHAASYSEPSYSAPGKEVYKEPAYANSHAEPVYTTPSYKEPAYKEPAYTTPSYKEPAYKEPAYKEPAYKEPAYKEPAYKEPAYKEPAYKEPAYKEPAYKEPAYKEPAYKEPAYKEPAYTTPSYKEPAYKEPAYKEPAYKEPAYKEPAYKEPAYTTPSYKEPAYKEPTYTTPSYKEPAYKEPVYTTPSYKEPAYKEPAYKEPAYKEPAYKEPAYTTPSYKEPAYKEPAYKEPAYKEPAYKEPAYTTPSYKEPAYKEPAYKEPAYKEPAYKEPAYKEPAYKEPAYKEPAYKEPAYTTPSYKEPAYTTPSYKEPAAYKEPAYTTPAYKEPAYHEPVYTTPSYKEPYHTTPSYKEPAYKEPSYSTPAYKEPAYKEPTYGQSEYKEPSKGASYTVVVQSPSYIPPRDEYPSVDYHSPKVNYVAPETEFRPMTKGANIYEAVSNDYLPPKRDPSKYETPKVETPKTYDIPPKYDAPKYEETKYDAPKLYEAPKKPQAPKYDTPRYEEPKYEEPKYEAPKYESSRYEAPKYEEPKYEAPKYETPKYEEPKYEAPKYETPKYEAPKYETPKYEEPKYEAPKYEAPKYEEPKYEAPKYEETKYEQPKYEAAQSYDTQKYEAPTTYTPARYEPPKAQGYKDTYTTPYREQFVASTPSYDSRKELSPSSTYPKETQTVPNYKESYAASAYVQTTPSYAPPALYSNKGPADPYNKDGNDVELSSTNYKAVAQTYEKPKDAYSADSGSYSTSSVGAYKEEQGYETKEYGNEQNGKKTHFPVIIGRYQVTDSRAFLPKPVDGKEPDYKSVEHLRGPNGQEYVVYYLPYGQPLPVPVRRRRAVDRPTGRVGDVLSRRQRRRRNHRGHRRAQEQNSPVPVAQLPCEHQALGHEPLNNPNNDPQVLVMKSSGDVNDQNNDAVQQEFVDESVSTDTDELVNEEPVLQIASESDTVGEFEPVSSTADLNQEEQETEAIQPFQAAAFNDFPNDGISGEDQKVSSEPLTEMMADEQLEGDELLVHQSDVVDETQPSDGNEEISEMQPHQVDVNQPSGGNEDILEGQPDRADENQSSDGNEETSEVQLFSAENVQSMSQEAAPAADEEPTELLVQNSSTGEDSDLTVAEKPLIEDQNTPDIEAVTNEELANAMISIEQSNLDEDSKTSEDDNVQFQPAPEDETTLLKEPEVVADVKDENVQSEVELVEELQPLDGKLQEPSNLENETEPDSEVEVEEQLSGFTNTQPQPSPDASLTNANEETGTNPIDVIEDEIVPEKPVAEVGVASDTDLPEETGNLAVNNIEESFDSENPTVPVGISQVSVVSQVSTVENEEPSPVTISTGPGKETKVASNAAQSATAKPHVLPGLTQRPVQYLKPPGLTETQQSNWNGYSVWWTKVGSNIAKIYNYE